MLTFNFVGNLVVLMAILLLAFFLMVFYLKLPISSISIWLFILFSWTIFQIFLKSLSPKYNFAFLNNWYGVPILLLIFKLTQIFTRIPLSLLAKKINSKKIVVLLTISIFIISLGLVLISNFALWSIFATTIASGITGSLFGMKNQQFSQSWNAQKTFMSACLVFFIPLISQLIGSTLNHIVNFDKISHFWLMFIDLLFSLCGLVGFAFLPKRFEKSLEPNFQKEENTFLIKRTVKDIIFLTLAYCLITSLYFFIIELSLINSFENTIILTISLIGSCFLAFFLLEKVNTKHIRLFSLIITILSFSLIGFFTILNIINKPLLMVLLSIGSFAFGIYNLLLFASTLNLDNKNRLLVFSIFLTINSLFVGLGQFFGKLTFHYFQFKTYLLGCIILVVPLVSFFLCELFASYHLLLKFKETKMHLNKILEKAREAELS